jgi:hypothetical protein
MDPANEHRPAMRNLTYRSVDSGKRRRSDGSFPASPTRRALTEKTPQKSAGRKGCNRENCGEQSNGQAVVIGKCRLKERYGKPWRPNWRLARET